MNRRRLIRAAVLVIAMAVATGICLLLYLRFADLSGWRNAVARALSDRLGREVRITGEFDPEIGRTTRIVVGGITLANAGWSDEPFMLAVDRLEAELDLWSLLSGPVTIRDATVAGARLVFESSAEGGLNWKLGAGGLAPHNGKPFGLVVEHALIEETVVLRRTPGSTTDLELKITRLEGTTGEGGLLDLTLDGSLQGRALHLAGRVGTLTGLINAAEIEHDLEGSLGDVHIATAGSIADLAKLTGVEAKLDAHSGDLDALRALLPIPDELAGPLRVRAEVFANSEGSELQLDAAVGEMTVQAEGLLDSLTRPRVVDATVAASGPSLDTIGTLARITGLPDEPFSLSGGVRWEGFPIAFREVRVRVGDNTIEADGVIGAPPAMLGTDFKLEGSGPDLSSLTALAGFRLPRERYNVSGRIVRVDDGIRVEDLKARVGRAELTATGFVGDPPQYADTAFSVHAVGPSLAPFSSVAGVGLPDRSFAFEGRLAEGRQGVVLQDVSARLGASTIALDGRLTTGQGRAGSLLKIRAMGPDASELTALAGLEQIPAEPWSADGTIHLLDRGLRLDGLTATLGGLDVRADGLLIPAPGLVGSDLAVHVEDAELSHTGSLAGVTNLPPQPLRVDGHVSIEAAGVTLNDLRASIGDLLVDADGLVGLSPTLDGSDLHIAVRGPNLASVGALVDQDGLPPAPFSVAGSLRIADGAWTADQLTADVDGTRLELAGTLVPSEDLAGTDLEIDLDGPDLRATGALARDLAAVPELPAEPFSLAAGIAIDPAGYWIRDLRVALADATVLVNGRVGKPPEFGDTDFSIDAQGPDSSVLQAFTGTSLPVAPFEARGRIRSTPKEFEFDRVILRLGDFHADVDGRVGHLPRLVGTDLEISAAGPNLEPISKIAGIPALPDLPFSIQGQLMGTPERFSADDLVASLGDSVLRGAFEVDITGKPSLTARFESQVLDLAPFAPISGSPEERVETAEETPAADTLQRVFSDTPIDFDLLRQFDADVEYRIDELRLPLKDFRDIEVDAQLRGGRLEIVRASARGQGGGGGSGRLVMEPDDDDYRVSAELDFDAVRLEPPGASTAAAGSRPPIDLDVVIEARGSSLHELATSSTGWIQLVAGSGVMDNSLLDAVSAPIIATLLDAFNPFSKQESTSQLQCAVVLVTLGDGRATLDPMVLKSNRMTMLGGGSVNLATERLNFQWVTKPRKGLGLSTSMLTNPYIRLGGSLSNPSIQLKEADAVVSTGAAVATAGISLAARGLWDRITAERNVCKKALKKISARQPEH